MKILLSTGSLHHLPAEKSFYLAKEFGFSGIEFYLQTPAQLFSISFQEIKKLSEKYKMPVFSIHSPSYERFPLQFLLNRKKIIPRTWKYTLNLAEYLNTEIIVIHPFPCLFGKEKEKEEFEKLLKIINNGKIKICIENMPKLLFLSPHILITPEEFREFCRKNNCFQTLDVTHCKTEKIEPAEFFERNREYILDIHISDYKSGKQHLPLGEGKIDFEIFFKKLKEENYNGFITLELTPANIPCMDVIKNCREYIFKIAEI